MNGLAFLLFLLVSAPSLLAQDLAPIASREDEIAIVNSSVYIFRG